MKPFSDMEVDGSERQGKLRMGPARLKVTEKRRLFEESSESSDDSDTEELDLNDNQTLLSILLVNPTQFERKCKPVGVRENFFCTLDRRIVSLESARADDNGAYLNKGTTKRFFKVTFRDDGEITSTRTCHFDKQADKLYITVRSGKAYNKVYLEEDEYNDVYALSKQYRISKNNSGFRHILSYVVKWQETDWCTDYFVSSYTCDEKNMKETFSIPRHGNAQSPTAPAYFKTEPTILKEVKSKILEKSPSFVYNELSLREGASSYSELVRNPKQIYNARQLSKEGKIPSDDTDFERLTNLMKNSADGDQFIQSVVMLPSSFVVIAFTDTMLKNLERFCVRGNSPLRFDTTFEIVNGMWVTDSSFTNNSLINDRDRKHPEFPGPFMLHFRKDAPVFQRFALEIVNGNLNLFEVRKIGRDMDRALKKGLTAVFREADDLVCLQHVSKRDAKKINDLGGGERAVGEILLHIYGSKQQNYQESGLADSSDEDEFNARLDSLREIWEQKVPGFHAWFLKNRAPLFIEQVVGEAMDRLT